jgi:uncharacterized repeat protein (TIGR03837 family)
MSHIRADLFCRVIDNLGDIGVMWRLARQLNAEKNWSIRLWVDNMAALTQLEPSLDPERCTQPHDGILIHQWTNDEQPPQHTSIEPQDVVIAGFSCDLPDVFVAKMSRPTPPVWLQLEYLSAEPWIRDFHGHSSLRNDGLAPVFFFPGFEPGTGGLLRESGLIGQRDQWQADLGGQLAWLNNLGISLTRKAREKTRLVSFFAYPEAPVDTWLSCLNQMDQPTIVLVPGNPVFKRLPKRLPNELVSNEHIRWQPIPFLSQRDYDRLLWSMDLNIVRGEDSFVRAIWAARPLIWHIYPQAEQTHEIKLNAWLARTSLPSQVQTALRQWVKGDDNHQLMQSLGQSLREPLWSDWQAASAQLSQTLAQAPDLANQIDEFCRQRLSKH